MLNPRPTGARKPVTHVGADRQFYLTKRHSAEPDMAARKAARPHVSVCVISRAGGYLLTITRSEAPCKGKLSLPGGHLEFGESPEKAALRELREETGLRGKISAFLGHQNMVFADGGRRYHIVMFVYRATVRTRRLVKGRDVKAAAWVRPKSVSRSEFCGPILSILEREGVV